MMTSFLWRRGKLLIIVFNHNQPQYEPQTPLKGYRNIPILTVQYLSQLCYANLQIMKVLLYKFEIILNLP